MSRSLERLTRTVHEIVWSAPLVPRGFIFRTHFSKPCFDRHRAWHERIVIFLSA